MLERGTVEVAPLAFMRGRTLNDSFIILDEAQNTTPEQMKMFLTRIGFGSKAVVTGDTTQVDVAGGRSGLDRLERILGGIDGLAFVRLTGRDVVRHRIVPTSSTPTSATRPPTRVPCSSDPPRTPRRGRRRRRGDEGDIEVFVADEQAAQPVDVERWEALARNVLEAEGVTRRCRAGRCCSSTRPPWPSSTGAFMGHDGPTDVLAFPIDDDDVMIGRSPDGSTSGPDRGPDRRHARCCSATS